MNEIKLYDNIKNSIIESGKKYGIEKIVLFGSRARGDSKERSDIDLAVYGGNVEEFYVDIEENVFTLLKFDVVDMNKSVQKELIESINNEGVIIYEKIWELLCCI